MFWMSAFLDLAPGSFDAGARFWSRVTGYDVSPRRGDRDEFATLVPGEGDDFLRVQELAEGPGRVHLDLHVDVPAAEAERAVARGRRGPPRVRARVRRPRLARRADVLLRGATGRRERPPPARVAGRAPVPRRPGLSRHPAVVVRRGVRVLARPDRRDACVASSVSEPVPEPDATRRTSRCGCCCNGSTTSRTGSPPTSISPRSDRDARGGSPRGARGHGRGAPREVDRAHRPASGTAYCLTDRDPETGLLP